MTDIVEVVEIKGSGTVEIIEVGLPGIKGDKGDKGDPGLSVGGFTYKDEFVITTTGVQSLTVSNPLNTLLGIQINGLGQPASVASVALNSVSFPALSLLTAGDTVIINYL